MKQTLIILLFAVLIAVGCQPAKQEPVKTKLEIKDGWFYINGEKFFVKALGYELGARPGEHPKTDTITDYERLRYDLKVIKDAGYNTIRTWAELGDEHLKIIQESGLKIMLGIGIKPAGPYADPAFQQEMFDLTRKVLAYSKNYDCIITYLILNEPMTDHIYQNGPKGMLDLMMGVKKIINEEHPGIPVSISGNTAIDEFLDMSVYDLNSFNSYDYNEGQDGTMGLTGFLRWIKARDEKNMPLVLTEFGYSVSDNGGGHNTYGGNTLEEQKMVCCATIAAFSMPVQPVWSRSITPMAGGKVGMLKFIIILRKNGSVLLVTAISTIPLAINVPFGTLWKIT
jgi:hypothetical protein